MVCCLCSQYPWWPWKTTIPGLFFQFPGDGLVWWWCPVAALSSWPPWNAQTEQVPMSAGDLFACQADAFIISLISFKFTCSLCSASEWLAAVRDVLHTPSVSRLWNVFSVLLYISFNRFSKKVKYSGSLAHFSIAQSAWWTDSVESKFTVTEEDPLALNILQILKNIHYYNTKVWLSCWTEFEYPGWTSLFALSKAALQCSLCNATCFFPSECFSWFFIFSSLQLPQVLGRCFFSC